MLKSPT
jgi:hypothetical protein